MQNTILSYVYTDKSKHLRPRHRAICTRTDGQLPLTRAPAYGQLRRDDDRNPKTGTTV